jgi:hypothetical protein
VVLKGTVLIHLGRVTRETSDTPDVNSQWISSGSFRCVSYGLGIRDGIQVNSSFHTDVNDLEYRVHTDVNDLEYKDLLTRILVQVDHERDMKNLGSNDGHPPCVF